MAPMHVLHIIDSLNVGGAEVLLCNLVQDLPRDRFRVSVAYSTPGPLIERIAAQGVHVTHLPRVAQVDPYLFWNMYHAIRQSSPDIVHTHLFKSDFHGRPAARLAGVPVVISTLHTCDERTKNPVVGRIHGQMTRFADMLIAVSEEVRQFAIRYTHVPQNKIISIDNAVPIQRFIGNEEQGRLVRAELGIAPQTLLVGIVARLVPEKDHATFLRSAVLIRQALPHVRFLIVGDGPLREDLIVQANSLGLQSAALFTGLRQDIPAVLAAIDLLMFSSSSEALPVALLEGMASGKPVVATAVGGIPGVIVEGQTGLLAARGDAEGLAAAAIQILQNGELASAMGKAGHERINAHYSNTAAIGRITELYERLFLHHQRRNALSGIVR